MRAVCNRSNDQCTSLAIVMALGHEMTVISLPVDAAAVSALRGHCLLDFGRPSAVWQTHQPSSHEQAHTHCHTPTLYSSNKHKLTQTVHQMVHLDWSTQAARRSVLQQTRHLLHKGAIEGTASRTLVIVDDNMQYRQGRTSRTPCLLMQPSTMRLGTTTKVLAKRVLNCYRVS